MSLLVPASEMANIQFPKEEEEENCSINDMSEYLLIMESRNHRQFILAENFCGASAVDHIDDFSVEIFHFCLFENKTTL